MEYIVTITTTDENGDTITTATTTTATNAKQAHDNATAIADGMNADTDGATIRVYPNTTTAAGIARGALQVARRMALNAVKRGGNETQWRIERETAAANARLIGAETAERIFAVIADYSHDTRDFFGTAAAALSTAAARGVDIAEQYHGAYIELNRYVAAQRAATEYETSTEFLMDGGGDLVSVNTAISRIMRGGDKWTPTDGNNMDAATAARLGDCLRGAFALLNTTQRGIVEMLARGYSQRRIAETSGRELSTVNRNIAIIREKCAAYIRDNGGEFVRMVDHDATAAAAKTAARDRHSESGAAAKKESDKATQAARAKAYRERKKAAQAAK